MRLLLLTTIIAACLAGSTGCTKDQDDTGYQAAMITFRQDSGYTYLDDTLPAGDSIHVGVTVEQGSEQLYTFLVERRYGNGTVQRMDSVHISAVPFHYTTLIVLHDQPGTEQWTFKAVEGSGDLTKRSLTFTTQ